MLICYCAFWARHLTLYYVPLISIPVISIYQSHTAETIPADANLRGVAHDIVHQAKLDAFTTLMEVKAAKAKCTSKTGCALTGGYDYCTQMKISRMGCGECNETAAGGIGMCQAPTVNVDKELAIVNSMSKEELLDVVAEVMDGYNMYDEEDEDSSDGDFA